MPKKTNSYKVTYKLEGRNVAYQIKKDRADLLNPEITGFYLKHPDGFVYDVIVSTLLQPKIFHLIHYQVQNKAKSTRQSKVLEYLDKTKLEVELTYDRGESGAYIVTSANVKKKTNAKDNQDSDGGAQQA